MPMGVYPRSTAEERLERDVDRSGECWVWTSKHNDLGYGMLMVNYQRWYAHRLAWTLANGPIPDGLCVLHRCDNPPCVRPAHLFLGTRTDNAKDRDQKGRGVKSRTYEEWVLQMALALHKECELEWQAIAVHDPTRQVTMHMADAHYGRAHDLVRRLGIATPSKKKSA
jgi:hypothetical protein